MTAGRPIGERIVSLCLELERIGPSGSLQIGRGADIEAGNAGKYCARAVGLGLMTVVRGDGNRSSYKVFSIVEGWRDIAKVRRTTRKIEAPIDAPVRPRTMWANANSAFSFVSTS